MKADKTERCSVTIELQPIPGPWLSPANRRLARLLKAAKHYGWRCTACKTAMTNNTKNT